MGKRVLCIDDSPTIRKLVHKALDSAGYQVDDAENGAQALEVASADHDLFIVDVNMPEMDGFEFVEAVKAKPNLAGKPVVFLTTESSDDKKARGKALGVNGWIVKPFEPESFAKVVAMLTGN
ncbi:MAG: response regulator [Spirochaetaceae bacterium]|nr:MAG: response regulator [Spirochaetaceae bacterium]